MIQLSKLEVALKNSWSKETTSDPDNWSQNNPSWGQCAVTSLVINDYIGGEIVWTQAKLPDGTEISHYLNKIGNKELDLTRNQFPEGTITSEGIPKTKGFPTTRDYILSFDKTLKRYQILKSQVEEAILSLP